MPVNVNSFYENEALRKSVAETYTPDQETNEIVGKRDSIENIAASKNDEYYQDHTNMPHQAIYENHALVNAHDANGGSDTNAANSLSQNLTDILPVKQENHPLQPPVSQSEGMTFYHDEGRLKQPLPGEKISK